MERFRLPIWGGMLGVVALAVSAALLRSPAPSPVLASLVFTGMLTLLILGTLGAIRGPWRTFCLGVAATGWIYAVLAFGPGAGTSTRPMLFTSFMLDWLYEHLPNSGNVGLRGGGPGRSGPLAFEPVWPDWAEEAGPRVIYQYRWEWQRYQRIGHSLAALAHGVAGGVVLLGLQWWGRRKTS